MKMSRPRAGYILHLWRVTGEVIGRRGMGGGKTEGAGEGLFEDGGEQNEEEGGEEEYASLFMASAATYEVVYDGRRKRAARWEGG